jgi:ArsR family transcriptional regulator
MQKKKKFTPEDQKLAAYARVLSHPARIAILRYLAQCGVCISGDISNEIPLSRTTVSQHLQELKSAGLIKGEIDGVKMNYCIDPEAFRVMQANFVEFFQLINPIHSLLCKSKES